MLGNHERKYLQYFTGERKWLPLHYFYALNVLLESGVKLSDFISFLESLPLVKRYERGDGKGTFIVAHAAVCLDDPVREDISMNVYGNMPENEKMPIPGDGKFYFWDHYQLDELVLYGHLSTQNHKPRIRNSPTGNRNSIGLDTGAVRGGSLFAYCVEEDKFYDYQSGVDYFTELKNESKINPDKFKFQKE